MASALWYLQATSLAGAVKLRLKRLKQPKYLLGSLLVLGYLAMMFGAQLTGARQMAMHHWDARAMEAMSTLWAVMLLVWVLFAWAVPSGRATLRFTEAEIAFLFSGPLSRVGLVNFSLLRAQLGIFLSAFLLSWAFARGRGLPGNSFQHATAIWLAVATLRLHTLAASFTLDRFQQGAEFPWLRRLVAPALVVLGLLGVVLWLATHLPAPGPLPDFDAVAHWLSTVVHTAPLSWLLAPFRLFVAPMFSATSPGAWCLSLLPVIALLLAHYLWVVRANVSFEEASIAAASKRAQQVQDMRSGKWPWRQKRKANNAPFPLAERGPPAVAFLWSGLIGAGGGLWRPRNVGIALLATVLVVAGVAASPWRPVLNIVGSVAGMLCLMSVLFGPMTMQGRLRDILELLDIYKASPLPGRQIALGQLLTPATLVALFQWYALFVVLLCVLANGGIDFGKLAFSWAGVFSVGLLGPLLCALLMCIPFAWILWFPAWASSLGTRGGGFEAAGQRLIFSLMYMIAAAVSLAPAALLGALVAWICVLLGAPWSLTVACVAVVAAIVLLVELAAIVHALGGRIDRFDVSTELR